VAVLAVAACGSGTDSSSPTVPSSVQQHSSVPSSVAVPGETGTISVQGRALPILGSGDDPAVGTKAPVVTGQGFDGEDITIGKAGRPYAVFVVAHWCPHCQREVPLLSRWLADGGAPEGVDLYTVATATRSDQANYPPSAWLNREGWPLPVVLDSADSDAAKALGVNGFPYFLLVNADGTVAGRFSGEASVADVQSRLEALAAPTTTS